VLLSIKKCNSNNDGIQINEMHANVKKEYTKKKNLIKKDRKIRKEFKRKYQMVKINNDSNKE